MDKMDIGQRPEAVDLINELTDQQEYFCQLVASGNTQAMAYKKAYLTDGWKPASIYSSASELASRNKISVRIAALRKELEEKTLWTRANSAQVLIEIINDESASNKDRNTALKELNAMHGYNQPTKIEITGKDGGAIETNATISAEEFVKAKQLLDEKY